jgi:hypothetical protein
LNNIDPSTAKQEAKAAAAGAAQNSFEAGAGMDAQIFRRLVGNLQGAYIHRLKDMIFPAIGKRPIKSITAPELLLVLRKIESRGAVCVTHLAMRECGRIFRYAIAAGGAERDVLHDLRGAITPMRTTRHLVAVTEARAIGKLLCSPRRCRQEHNNFCT